MINRTTQTGAMLAHLIAFDVLTGDLPSGIGELQASPDQIVTVPALPSLAVVGNGLPLGAQKWARPFDPSDRAPYAWNFTPPLDGAKIAEIIRLTMSAAGAALGVKIDDDLQRAPVVTDDGKHAQIWIKVDPAEQANPAFAGSGVQVVIAALVRTTDSVYREYERTGVVTVRQL